MSDARANEDGEASAQSATAPVRRRPGRPRGSRNKVPAAVARPGAPRPRAGRDELTIEQIVAVDPPREHRLHPRGTAVAYTAEAAGARQIFVLPLRPGLPIQITASEKAATDPQWSPDGRRLAFVRDDAVWVVEADGSRESKATGHPAGTSHPRWAPDGLRLAFISRRRGWAQVWVIDAPVPRRGRPSREPRAPEPRAVSPIGLDVFDFAWSPDGRTIAIVGERGDEAPAASPIVLVDLDTGKATPIDRRSDWEAAPAWAPDGGLLFVTDRDEWFHVTRRSPDGTQTAPLTAGKREHGEPSGADGFQPRSSPDGGRFTYPEFHDGLVDILVAPLATAPAKRGRGRPPKNPRPQVAPGRVVNPWPGVWRMIGWLPDGAWIAAIGESDSRPPDLWLLPVPGSAADGARPRQVTDSMPAIVAAAFVPGRSPAAERIEFKARDGLPIEGTLWRPARATGRRGGSRVPTIVYPHGGPRAQALRSWLPFKQLLVRSGFAFIDVDFRGSTGYGRAFRLANTGEWGHADTLDLIDAGRWAQAQPWSDGRLVIYGGSYGGYLTLCALVDEPSMWTAGVDLYGDSDIAESYRHGDRVGRLDLHRMMGSPEDPARQDIYRRGSPIYRAERIEAPLLILHGRKDKRVVPLMTEKMVEALEIEGKHHEVQWYDEEAHGWEKLDTRRDAYRRILKFLKRHVLGEETPESD
jgi:dipeptidyl aminopeptidase/acylaminoacyl peptidase